MAYWLGRHWTHHELLQHVGQIEQIAGIKALEAVDGLERGVRVFEVWTGTGLFFHVLADRALDISTCSYKGIPLAWRSSNGDVHPSYFEPHDKGFLRTSPSGLFTTCGLDQFGAPSTDQGEDFPQHGRVANIPARAVSYRTYWNGDECELEISGEVRQTRIFGENLLLQRRISTRLGSNAIHITDTVTNEGFAPQPHMILYHFNIGFPLLSSSTQLHLDVEKTTARDDDARAGLHNWNTFEEPKPNYREQVFHHDLKADLHGEVTAEVRNPDLGLSLRWRYDKSALPHLFEWKQMGEGTYALGVEPANCGTQEGRAAARQQNILPHLQPGESRTYTIGLELVATQ